MQMASTTVPCEEKPEVKTGHTVGEVVIAVVVVVVVMVIVTAGAGKGWIIGCTTLLAEMETLNGNCPLLEAIAALSAETIELAEAIVMFELNDVIFEMRREMTICPLLSLMI